MRNAMKKMNIYLNAEVEKMVISASNAAGMPKSKWIVQVIEEQFPTDKNQVNPVKPLKESKG
jgi:hypothetical protein